MFKNCVGHTAWKFRVPKFCDALALQTLVRLSPTLVGVLLIIWSSDVACSNNRAEDYIHISGTAWHKVTKVAKSMDMDDLEVTGQRLRSSGQKRSPKVTCQKSYISKRSGLGPQLWSWHKRWWPQTEPQRSRVTRVKIEGHIRSR